MSVIERDPQQLPDGARIYGDGSIFGPTKAEIADCNLLHAPVELPQDRTVAKSGRLGNLFRGAWRAVPGPIRLSAAVLAITAVAAWGDGAKGENDSVGVDTPINWTREEVLFWPNAGFEKARNGETGETLTVWVDPVLDLDADKIIAPWNGAAGWNLFSVASEDTSADIQFVEGDITKAIAQSDNNGNFTKCVVFYNPNRLWLHVEERIETAQHELGHCLGFVDFITEAHYEGNHVNPNRCDIPGREYSGIMAYCGWRDFDKKLRFGDAEEELLRIAGYAR